MNFPEFPPRPMARTLRVLARLLEYPDGALRAHLAELPDVLRAERALLPSRLADLEALIHDIEAQDPLDAEADYVQLFDSGRRTALHLFEHVHGDSRDRGPAMIDLAQTYERAGLYLAPGEMPDYLPVLLEFASTQPPREAASLLGEIGHLLNGLRAVLEKRDSRYAAVMAALLELAGTPAQAVAVGDEPPADATWEEPAAFEGCAASAGAGTKSVHPIRPERRQSALPNGAAR